MTEWTVGLLAAASEGRLLQGNPYIPVGSISTDTRTVRDGDCFVALPGDRFDGHTFLAAAVAKGAVAVILAKDRPEARAGLPDGIAVIEVEDTLTAYGSLARYRRGLFHGPVIGITGSNGKTSTKEMLAGVLGKSYRVLKNQGNFNNLVGVPMTLLAMDREHEAAVIEMGINVPGEMERLVGMVRPTAGIITNVHPAHLEGLGSLERILEEKGKLWSALGDDGLAVVNADDKLLEALSHTLACRKIRFSVTDAPADVRLGNGIEILPGGTRFTIDFGGEKAEVLIPLLGLHQVRNALAAAAAAFALGMSPADIASGLTSFLPARQRMQIHTLRGGRVLVDDTYNANPCSMLAAVQTVLQGSGGAPVVAVLGEMRELGPDSPVLHRDLGKEIGTLGLSCLITLGGLGEQIAEGALEAGMTRATAVHASSHEEIVKMLEKGFPEGAWLLVKGSRGMTMERVVQGVLADENDKD